MNIFSKSVSTCCPEHSPLVNVINCWGTSPGQHRERISAMITPAMFSLNWMDSGQIWFHHLNVNVDFEATNQLVVHAFYMMLHPIPKNYLVIFEVIWVQAVYSSAPLGVHSYWPTPTLTPILPTYIVIPKICECEQFNAF